MSTEDGNRTKIGPSSWVSTTFLAGILAAACMGTVYAVRVVDRLDTVVRQEDKRDLALSELTRAVSGLQQTVDKLADAPEFRVWVANLARMNPNVNVPDFVGPFHDDGRRK